MVSTISRLILGAVAQYPMWRFAIALILSVLLPLAAVSQTSTIIESKTICPACKIELQLVATISDDPRSPKLGEQLMVSADARGFLYGTDLVTAPGQVLIFDRGGRFLRSIGRLGAGPGEFKHVVPPFFGSGDTMYIVDYSLRRLSRFTPAGQYIDVEQFPGTPRQLISVPGGFVVSGMIRTADRVGWPLHRINSKGLVINSFGSETPVLVPRAEILSRRAIAYSPPNHVWSAFLHQYVVERWSLEGQRQAVFERRPEWFESDLNFEGPATVVRPPSQIRAIWEDEQKRLWVAIHVADANWRRTNLKAKPGDMIPMPRAENHSIYDTILEVIDPVRGVTIASQRFPQFIVSMGNGQPFISYHEDEVGNPSYKIWRPHLQIPGGTR